MQATHRCKRKLCFSQGQVTDRHKVALSFSLNHVTHCHKRGAGGQYQTWRGGDRCGRQPTTAWIQCRRRHPSPASKLRARRRTCQSRASCAPRPWHPRDFGPAHDDTGSGVTIFAHHHHSSAVISPPKQLACAWKNMSARVHVCEHPRAHAQAYARDTKRTRGEETCQAPEHAGESLQRASAKGKQR